MSAIKPDLKPRALQLHRDGLTPSLIAERLSVPRGTVRNWLTGAGVELPKKPVGRQTKPKSIREIVRELRARVAKGSF